MHPVIMFVTKVIVSIGHASSSISKREPHFAMFLGFVWPQGAEASTRIERDRIGTLANVGEVIK